MRASQDARMPGWFWWPDEPASRVPGILTWTQAAGGVLELIGGLDPTLSPESSWPVVVDDVTIHGETSDGRPVTLWEAQSGSSRTQPGGRWIEQFWETNWVVVGCHLPSPAMTSLRAVTAHIDNLYYLTLDGRICPPAWTTGIPGVDQPFTEQPDGTTLYPWSIGVVGGHRAAISAGTLGGLHYRVATDATRPWISRATEEDPGLELGMMTARDKRGRSIEIAVTASAHIEAPSDDALRADKLLRSLAPMLNLVRLATFERPGLDALSAVTTSDVHLDVLCRSGHPAAPDASPGAAASPVFTLVDLDLQTFLDFWERSTQTPQARYALNAALGIIGHHPRFVEEGFSQTLAAAEGFHTWCLDRKGDYSLRDRLRSLHDELPEAIRQHLNISADPWSDWAKWARNHVDHGGANQHRHLTTLQMKHLSDSVALVLYLRMLTAMGVSETRLVTALNDHSRLSWLSQVSVHLDLPSYGPGKD